MHTCCPFVDWWLLDEHQDRQASLVAQLVKNLPAMRETWVQSLSWEDPLEKGRATHSSILAWRMPWTYNPWSSKEPDTTERLSHTHTRTSSGLLKYWSNSPAIWQIGPAGNFLKCPCCYLCHPTQSPSPPGPPWGFSPLGSPRDQFFSICFKV